ncbi:predicted protein [Naegleria gruberi]|uniref:Splicing factor Cactin n=1 Tax=Naegleria gruberi TaxID=5762 RepID=D2V221_NAEGR|nr:uncharacterized protein NAEGRDRAFT_46061 [Naegleria gruberi]EFC48828.1 predicted protein [Naegleria gruberi]|eukprot:XP_002681572.1 predicted protein [Naegleria gruberi strain NEG-M]
MKRQLEDPIHSEKKQKSNDHGKDVIKMLGYTNDENPFNDSNLSEKFVWTKQEDNSSSLTENKRKEILLLKQQRLEREMEKRRWEMERERVFREREAERFDEYEKKESEFHLKQENLASFIRLRERRAKLIDFVTNNLKYLRFKDKLLGDDYDSHLILSSEHERIYGVEYKKPYEVFHDRKLQDLLDSQEDLETMIECDIDYQDFWRALSVIVKDEINLAKEYEKKKVGKEEERTKDIHASVVAEIKELLSDKNLDELLEMEQLINETLDNRDASTDVEYWEGLKKYLQIYKARNIVSQIHQEAIKVYEQMKKNGTTDRIFTQHNTPSSYKDNATQQKKDHNSISGGASNEDDRLMREYKNKETEEGDEDTVEEVKLVNQQYAWNDKYRPRKPKFFNRVRTGYEWTNYNRTHYDFENPPPKVIQGYKFNIFYPDLIDRSITPSYALERDPNNDEFSILTFHSGPPYEDISFRIVNREWEKSHRRGYRCVFERGVLQLHFKFKKLKFQKD